MSARDKELPIPEPVLAEDENEVTELMRVWWCRDKAQSVIRTAAGDPKLIGGILAELAWHFSNAYAQNQGMNQANVFTVIREGWDEAHKLAAEAPPALSTTPVKPLGNA